MIIGVSHVTDFTAVSMRPIRPPIAWKKSSSGDKPEINELSMNPRANGPSSNLLKCGKVRLSKPYEIRLPSIACCPRHEIICEMFKSVPFEPERTNPTNRFVELRLLIPILPASFVALFRILDTFTSNSASFDFPVLFSKMPR